MIPALKAELRKLFSVRSTYIATGLAAAFVVFYAFYIQGWRLAGADLHDPSLLMNDVVGALTSLPLIFGSVIAILLMTHEYRYNTIMYTLTAANSRTKVLLAKILAISGFTLVFTALIAVLAPLMTYLGVHAHGHTLVTQNIPYGSLVWRSLFYGWGSIVVALLLAALIRNQVGAITALFAIPTLEQVLALLLKKNAIYLPFMASNEVMTKPEQGSITYAHAALVFGGYLLVGWLVAWILFLRRDAN